MHDCNVNKAEQKGEKKVEKGAGATRKTKTKCFCSQTRRPPHEGGNFWRYQSIVQQSMIFNCRVGVQMSILLYYNKGWKRNKGLFFVPAVRGRIRLLRDTVDCFLCLSFSVPISFRYDSEVHCNTANAVFQGNKKKKLRNCKDSLKSRLFELTILVL